MIWDEDRRLRLRAKLNAPVWARFVVTPAATTLFVGLYNATRAGTAPFDWIDPLSGQTEAARSIGTGLDAVLRTEKAKVDA